jgi:2-polyprenyl-3-methyl-5-hydroxy-6-metoxy-1,4-benzoquinol methylase
MQVIEAVDKAVEEAQNYKCHEKQGEYDKLLHDEYVFSIEKLGEYLKKGSVLDVGTAYGTASVALKYLGYDVKACDLTRDYLNAEQLRAEGIPFAKCDIEKEDLKASEMDAVIFTEVLEHLNTNPQKGVDRLRKCLKKGGYCLITTPSFENQGQAPGIWGRKISYRYIPEKVSQWYDEHTHHFNQVELISLMEKAGFDVVEIGFCYHGLSSYVVGKAR